MKQMGSLLKRGEHCVTKALVAKTLPPPTLPLLGTFPILATMVLISVSMLVCKVAGSLRICLKMLPTRFTLPSNLHVAGSFSSSSHPPFFKNLVASLCDLSSLERSARMACTSPLGGGNLFFSGLSASKFMHSTMACSPSLWGTKGW